jgi:hypothetical protein
VVQSIYCDFENGSIGGILAEGQMKVNLHFFIDIVGYV